MTRTVLLPKDIENRYVEFANMREGEAEGFFIYRKEDDNCYVAYQLLSGVGNAERVGAEERFIDIVNEFLDEYADIYGYIRVHTHSIDTIEQYGEHYAKNLSGQDISNILSDDDPDYMEILITPKATRLYSRYDTELRIVDGYPGHREENAAVKEKFHEIAENLGYDITGLDDNR